MRSKRQEENIIRPYMSFEFNKIQHKYKNNYIIKNQLFINIIIAFTIALLLCQF